MDSPYLCGDKITSLKEAKQALKNCVEYFRYRGDTSFKLYELLANGVKEEKRLSRKMFGQSNAFDVCELTLKKIIDGFPEDTTNEED